MELYCKFSSVKHRCLGLNQFLGHLPVLTSWGIHWITFCHVTSHFNLSHNDNTKLTSKVCFLNTPNPGLFIASSLTELDFQLFHYSHIYPTFGQKYFTSFKWFETNTDPVSRKNTYTTYWAAIKNEQKPMYYLSTLFICKHYKHSVSLDLSAIVWKSRRFSEERMNSHHLFLFAS